jgi:uncharacterized protein YndB with AHSA1/START domain
VEEIMSNESSNHKTSSEIRSKIIKASPAQVFAAISDPLRVAKWWGPDGFRSTVHQHDLHVGGKWRLTMHGSDGKDYPNEYQVLRLVQDSLIEFEHDYEVHYFILTLVLTQVGNSTRVSWHQTFKSAEEYQQIAEFLAQANEQVLERLRVEVQRLM